MIKIISFEDFKKIYNAIPGEPEFELYFKNTNNTYMIIKYKEAVTFQRCGTMEEKSDEIKYATLDELYNAKLIDGIMLKRDWNLITEIVIDETFNVLLDMENIKEIYDIEI